MTSRYVGVVVMWVAVSGALRRAAVLLLMRVLDWAIVAVYLVWIVYDGLRLTKRSKEIDGYFRGNRSLP
jgi:hypothetical protein